MSNVRVRFCFDLTQSYHILFLQFRNNQWMEWISSQAFRSLIFLPVTNSKYSIEKKLLHYKSDLKHESMENMRTQLLFARENFERDLTEISQWKLPNAKVWFLERSLNSRQKQWESVAMTAERLMINFIAQMSGTPSGALTPLTFSLIF